MSNIRVRKETGRLFLDFRVFGIRCREQTELVDSKVNRKLLAKLDENIKAAVANGSYRHEYFFPISKRIAEVEEARLTINKASTNLALAIPRTPSVRITAKKTAHYRSKKLLVIVQSEPAVLSRPLAHFFYLKLIAGFINLALTPHGLASNFNAL